MSAEIETKMGGMKDKLDEVVTKIRVKIDVEREKKTQQYLKFLTNKAHLLIEFDDKNEAESKKYLEQALEKLKAGWSVVIPLVPHKGTMDSLVLYWVINQFFQDFAFALISSIKFELPFRHCRADITEDMGSVTKGGIVEFFVRTLFKLDPRSIRYAVIQLYLINSLKNQINQDKAKQFNRKQMTQLVKAIVQGSLVVGFMPEATRDKEGKGLQRAAPGCFKIAKPNKTLILPLIVSTTDYKPDEKLLTETSQSTTQFSLTKPITWSDAQKQVGLYRFTNEVSFYNTDRNPVSPGEKLKEDDIIMWWIAQNMPNMERGVYQDKCIEEIK